MGSSLFLALCSSVDFTNKSSVPSRLQSLNDHCIPDCVFADELDSDVLKCCGRVKKKASPVCIWEHYFAATVLNLFTLMDSRRIITANQISSERFKNSILYSVFLFYWACQYTFFMYFPIFCLQECREKSWFIGIKICFKLFKEFINKRNNEDSETHFVCINFLIFFNIPIFEDILSRFWEPLL